MNHFRIRCADQSVRSSFRFLLVVFLVKIWRAWEWPRLIFPDAVTLNRLAAPLCVFCFNTTNLLHQIKIMSQLQNLLRGKVRRTFPLPKIIRIDETRQSRSILWLFYNWLSVIPEKNSFFRCQYVSSIPRVQGTDPPEFSGKDRLQTSISWGPI